MPDGYGNDMPSWALAPPPRHKEASAKWLMAAHLRADHGYALHKIAKVCGLPYNEVRSMLGEDE